MTITALSPTGKTKMRVQIDFDRSFILTNRELVQYGIRLNEELSDAAFEEIQQSLYRRAIRTCGELLGKMDYTEGALTDKLYDRGYPEDIVKSAIDALKRAGYVDDGRYARNYVLAHIEDRSLRRIRADLKRRGISDTLADEAFAEWEEENGIAPGEKEEGQIRQLLQKKRYNPETADWQETQKIMSFLARRGYSTEQIRRAVRP